MKEYIDVTKGLKKGLDKFLKEEVPNQEECVNRLNAIRDCLELYSDKWERGAKLNDNKELVQNIKHMLEDISEFSYVSWFQKQVNEIYDEVEKIKF